MKTSIQHISIPNQCSQPWDEMTPTEQGRHCDACQKVVIDFTSMTDQELIHYFEKRVSEKVCGRFERVQVDRLNRKLVLNKERYVSRLFKAISLVFLGLSFSNLLPAQAPNSYKLIKKESLNGFDRNSFIVLEGKVTYGEYPIIMATGFIETVQMKIRTDLNGNFQLAIPKIILDANENNFIEFNYVGFDNAKINLNEIKNQLVEIELTSSIRILGGAIISLDYPWYKRWWYWLTRRQLY